jgi:UDP-N-acetylmuramoyl-tripeptide--D-alanyl-D-alanine ligase
MLSSIPAGLLWNTDRLVAALPDFKDIIYAAWPHSWYCTDLHFDSRCIKPGFMFLALSGGNRDGHLFIRDAIEKGAHVVLAEYIPDDCKDASVPIIVLPNIQDALWEMGRFARFDSAATFIAVTGSVGKTSTKELLNHVIGKQRFCFATPGNFNNHIGLPLTLCRVPFDATHVIIEMGMNHQGEIEQLTSITRPHIAIITAIAEVHLEHFDNLDGIAKAKAEIFSGLFPPSAVFLPKHSPYFDMLANKARTVQPKARILSFGHQADANYHWIEESLHQNGEQLITEWSCNTTHYQETLPRLSHGMLDNIAAVLACVDHLGLNISSALEALKDWEEAAGRGKQHNISWHNNGHITIIDDSYNASPISVQSALAHFTNMMNHKPLLANTRHIIVLADMYELGPDAEKIHAQLAEHVVTTHADMVITAGPLMRALYKKLTIVAPKLVQHHVEQTAQLESLLPALLRDGDTVLFKGSHGTALHLIVEKLCTNQLANIFTHPELGSLNHAV